MKFRRPPLSVRTVVFGLVALLIPNVAAAHIDLLEPASRYSKSNIKSAPCGDGSDTRSEEVATFRAGETITVKWDEYIDHPGHFRIAFDRDGTDDFEPPKCTSGCSSSNPQFAGNVNDAVLVDLISDNRGGTYTEDVQLPDVDCDRCTLQVIQVMYDKPPYEVPGNDIYYQCADLKLVGSSTGDTGTDADTGPAPEPDAAGGDASDAATRGDSGDPGDGTDAAGEGADGAGNGGTEQPSPAGDSGGGCSTVGTRGGVPPLAGLLAWLFAIVGVRRFSND